MLSLPKSHLYVPDSIEEPVHILVDANLSNWTRTCTYMQPNAVCIRRQMLSLPQGHLYVPDFVEGPVNNL